MKFLICSFLLILIFNLFLKAQQSAVHSSISTSNINSPHDLSLQKRSSSTNLNYSSEPLCQSCHSGSKKETNTNSSIMSPNETKSVSTTNKNTSVTSFPVCCKSSTPNGISLYCLSCHDGSVAQNRLIRKPQITIDNSTNSDSAETRIDFLNSHPVSFVYDPSAYNELWPINHNYNDSNTVQDLLDENNKVQCLSCHTMHNNEFGYLLRIRIEKSELCLACHRK